jgi:hypothetical protein
MVRVDGRGAREGLRDLQAGLHQAAALALRATVDAAAQSARQTTLFNDKTGETRGSVTAETVGDSGSVEAGGAAVFLENGTAPHEIWGNPTLAFQVNGATIFAAHVNHPGTAARPFMAQAAQVGMDVADYSFEFFLNYAISRSNRG